MKFDSIPFPQVGFREIPNLHGAREQLRSKRKKGDHVHSRAVRARMAHSSLWDRLPEEIQHRIQTTAEELRLKFAPSWFDVSSTDGPMLRDIIKEHMKATHVTTPKPGLHRLRRSKLLAIVKKHGVTKEAFNVKRPFWVESDHRAFSRFAALKVGDTIPFQCWHSRYPNTAIHAKVINCNHYSGLCTFTWHPRWHMENTMVLMNGKCKELHAPFSITYRPDGTFTSNYKRLGDRATVYT